MKFGTDFDAFPKYEPLSFCFAVNACYVSCKIEII